MRNHNDMSKSMTPEYCANQLKILQTQQQYTSIRHVLKSNKTNGAWMKDFLGNGGFHNLLSNITLVCLPENRPNDSALSALVACVSVVMGTKHGLDSAATSPNVLNSLILGMISKDELVKRDVLTLLSTLTLHSSTAYKYVTEAFDHFKKTEHVTYRFIVLVDDLKKTESVEYRKSLLNFINCLIDRCTIPDKRIDLRNEIIALGLLEVLKSLRHTQNGSVAQQIIHFYEQKARDEMKLSPTLDVNNPPAMFALLWRKIAKTPRSNDLMRIVQKLLFTVETSDLWGAAIEALSGPRSTQGVFKDVRNSGDLISDEKNRFPEPPDSPSSYAPPQCISWQPVEPISSKSVWDRVNSCQNKTNVRNIGNFFFQSHPSKRQLRFIAEEKAILLNLLLASVDSNTSRKAAVNLVTKAVIEADSTIIPELCLQRLSQIIPKDPALLTAISEFDADPESLDSSELLLVSLSRIPEFETRLKCMLGVMDIPTSLDSLEACEAHYSNILTSLVDEECPFFDLLKLVLDIGNTLNESGPVSGFKLGALQQLRNMRAPRQPSLTLLHFVTQSLAKNSPNTLDFLTQVVDELFEIKKKTVQEFDEELQSLEVKLREIRSLLVVASKDVKLQFTSIVVESGKRVTQLKNKRKSLDNRINSFAEFYCEPITDFCLSTYLSNLHAFCSDVLECKEIYDLSTISSSASDNRSKFTFETKANGNDQSKCPYHGYNCFESCSHYKPRDESLFSPQPHTRTHSNSVNSSYSTAKDSAYSSTKRATTEMDGGRAGSFGRRSSDGQNSRRDTYESTKSEPVGSISLESRLLNSPPPKPQRPAGIVFDPSMELTNYPGGRDRCDSKKIQNNRRSGELKKLHNNYRSVDLTYNRTRSNDYYDRYHSAEYRSRQFDSNQSQEDHYKDRYRHSPPTREQDEATYQSGETSSDDSIDDSILRESETVFSQAEMKKKGDSPLKKTDLAASLGELTPKKNDKSSGQGNAGQKTVKRKSDISYADTRSKCQESRTVGHAASVNMAPPVSFLNNSFGGSCRTHQKHLRTDVRDIFASNDRDRMFSGDRYGSTSSINTAKQKNRGARANPQQSSLQEMLRGDQNSNANTKKEPPPIPKREPLGGKGMGKKENSRSTPALFSNPYKRSHSFSPLPMSPPTASPTTSPALSPTSPLSPQLPGTLSPGSMSPPPTTLSSPIMGNTPPTGSPLSAQAAISPPTRYSRDRPVSAGARKQQTIDENEEVHHDRQASEPADMRYCQENSRQATSIKRGLSVSTSEMSINGLETEV